MSEEEIIKYIKDEIENEIDTFHWFDNTPKNETRRQIEESIKAHQGLLDLYKTEKEKNIELLTRLRADGLIERDKYWISKIKEALYNGTSDAKGWGCEDGAYCVEKQFKQLLEKGE